MTAWMPIETAPKDGTSILVAHRSLIHVVYWNDEARDEKWPWYVEDADFGYHRDYPAHWQPLPAPPSP